MEKHLKIKGKKYKWSYEDMDARLILGLFVAGIVLIAASFWMFLCTASAIWG